MAWVATSACASTPPSGALADGSTATPRITAVDTARPPRSAWVQLDQPAYAALMLVAPGRSATLLYPSDSTVDNHLSAGAHQLGFRLPGTLTLVDTIRSVSSTGRGQPRDTGYYPGRVDPTRGPRTTTQAISNGP